MLLIQVDKSERPAVKLFLSKYRTRAAFKAKGAEVGREHMPPLTFSFAFWYKHRTLDQNALYHALLTILAYEAYGEFGHETELHEEILNLYAVRMDSKLRPGTAPKRSSDMTTVEFSRLVEGVFHELATLGVDMDAGDKIRQYWQEWHLWRGKQKEDPLCGDYKSVNDYRNRVCFCEACLKYLGNDERGSIAHIVSRGAGGPDYDWNLFRLCDTCHTGLGTADGDRFDEAQAQHKVGWDAFLVKYPHLKWKYQKAHTKNSDRIQGHSDPGAGPGIALPDDD
jgi:hypothetical protein